MKARNEDALPTLFLPIPPSSLTAPPGGFSPRPVQPSPRHARYHQLLSDGPRSPGPFLFDGLGTAAAPKTVTMTTTVAAQPQWFGLTLEVGAAVQKWREENSPTIGQAPRRRQYHLAKPIDPIPDDALFDVGLQRSEETPLLPIHPPITARSCGGHSYRPGASHSPSAAAERPPCVEGLLQCLSSWPLASKNDMTSSPGHCNKFQQKQPQCEDDEVPKDLSLALVSGNSSEADGLGGTAEPSSGDEGSIEAGNGPVVSVGFRGLRPLKFRTRPAPLPLIPTTASAITNPSPQTPPSASSSSSSSAAAQSSLTTPSNMDTQELQSLPASSDPSVVSPTISLGFTTPTTTLPLTAAFYEQE